MAATCEQIAKAALGNPAKKSSGELLWNCPQHEDRHPSLAVNPTKNAWMCGPCGAGGTVWQLAAFLTGVSASDKRAVATWLKDCGLIEETIKPTGRRIAAEYSYQDANGRLLFQTIRFDPKDFAYRRPNGRVAWVWNLQGIGLVPYRLPAVLGAESVWIVEGEKDCDELAKWGTVATTNPMGAGKWRAQYNSHFSGKHVYIIPDNDEGGRKHAQAVAANLLRVAKTVRIVTLPGLQPKGDFGDWKAAGGTMTQLAEIAGKAIPVTGADLPDASFSTIDEVPGMGGIPDLQVEWLIENFLPLNPLTILAGMKGSYKSWLALEVAARLATGSPFASRTVKRLPVAYLDRENPAAVVRLRRDILKIGDPPLLRYWGQWMTDPPCSPGDERLIEFVRARRPLIIFDSLVRFHRGEENSAEQMAMVTNLFRNLVAVGATVLVIAHRSDKPGSPDYRGSSELLAGCDVA